MIPADLALASLPLGLILACALWRLVDWLARRL